MFIPTPLSLVTWICTVRGWVVLQSVIMAAGYFALAWALRRPVWNFVAALYQNVISYNVLKGILNQWIPKIKWHFRFALAYAVIGACGAIGAILSAQPLLWVYAIYLFVSWCFNAYEMYQTLQAILGLEGDLEKACTYVGGILGLGDCGEFFTKIKRYTIGAICLVLLLQATTLICVVVLIRREYRKTGFLFTDLFSSEKEKNKCLDEIEQKKYSGHKEKMESLAHSSSHPGPRQRWELGAQVTYPLSDEDCFSLPPRKKRLAVKFPPTPDGRRVRSRVHPRS